MQRRYLDEPLPSYGTTERRAVRLALIDYRDRIMAKIEDATINQDMTDEQIGMLEFYMDKTDAKLYLRGE